MERVTRRKDKYSCRVYHCPVEDWMYDLYGELKDKDYCESCPVMFYANRLAEYEDKQDE